MHDGICERLTGIVITVAHRLLQGVYGLETFWKTEVHFCRYENLGKMAKVATVLRSFGIS